MPRTFPVVNTFPMGRTVRSHVVDSTTTIYGYAVPGTPTSADKWEMFKVIDNGTDMSLTYADGNDNADNIWDDYTNETFS